MRDSTTWLEDVHILALPGYVALSKFFTSLSLCFPVCNMEMSILISGFFRSHQIHIPLPSTQRYSLPSDTFPLCHHCILYAPPPSRFSRETSDWEVRGGGQETQKQRLPVGPTPQHERTSQSPCRLMGLSGTAQLRGRAGTESSGLPSPKAEEVVGQL